MTAVSHLRIQAMALLVWVAACTHTSTSPSSRPGINPADFYPLAVGNEWVYLDHSPTVKSGQSVERTVRILKRDGQGYFHDNQRGELRFDAGCLRDRVRRLLCKPVEVGKGWLSVVSESSTERYEIAAVAERITTPAGQFDGCVRVRAHNRAAKGAQYVLETTYAPGVGVVRLESYVIVNGTVAPQVKAELKSYRVVER